MIVNKFNFNLLRSLDALISEQNVTRAAARLNVTQSAMSSSLNQLRILFNDELLVRCQHGMLPTPKAQQLALKIKPLIHSIHELREDVQFIAKTSTKTFHLALTEMVAKALLPKLMSAFNKQAPDARIEVNIIDNATDQTSLLIDPKFELYIGYAGSLPKNFQQQFLRELDCVCIGKKGNPFLKGQLTLEKYISAQHMYICAADHAGFSDTDTFLQMKNKKRNIQLTVPNVMTGLDILKNATLPYIATTTKYAVSIYDEDKEFSVKELPFKLPSSYLNQIWHQRFEHDDAHIWLRSLVHNILTE